MKIKLLTFLILGSLTGTAFANCGNDNGNGNGCSGSGTPGPTGPQGPQGQAGLNGSNGTNGQNGVNGQNGSNGVAGTPGKDGKDTSAAFHGTDLAADVAVRLVDTKYFEVQVYDVYVFGSTPGSDVFGNGHNSTIGGRFVFKLGSSYEDRRIEALNAKLSALEARLARVQE